MKTSRWALATVLAASAISVAAWGATERRVTGIITAVGGGTMTVAPLQGKQCVTGKLDAKTRILVDGHAAKAADLRVTESAKAELGLDDTWTSVVATTH